VITLNVDEITILHGKIIAVTGGAPGLRDAGLLESATLGCYQSFNDIELYPTIIEKAARMAFSICKNHPFIDGNKRVAVTAMLVMLRLNNIALSYTQGDLSALGIGIADGSLEYDEIVKWIKAHQINL